MKKKTILIVPPQGSAVKAIRIRLSVAVALFVLVTIGFAGYFIPFNSLTLNVVEQNQKKNLSDQNKSLLQRINSTLKLLNNLKDQVGRLEEKRLAVSKSTTTGNNPESQKKTGIDFSRLQADEMLVYVESQESKLKSFIGSFEERSNIFERIPVISPVPGSQMISRRFGSSRDPFSENLKWHNGIDFVASEAYPVIATASGTVTRVENHPVWGKRIHIDHGEFRTIYAHLGKTGVAKGKKVNKGDEIGSIGMSGFSTGPHIHYEIWCNGSAVNPEDYFFPDIESASLDAQSGKNL